MALRIITWSFLLSILFIGSTYSNCQTSKIDSLTQQFLSTTDSKSEIKTIDRFTEELSDSDFEVYKHGLQKTLSKLHKEEDKIQLAKYYYFLGYKYFLRKDDVESIKYLLIGLNFIDATKNNYLNFYYNFRIATSYARIGYYTKASGTYPKAIKYYLKCIKILQSQPNNENDLVSVYTLLAHSYHGVKDTANSELFYKKSENLARKINDRTSIVKAMLNRGNLYMRYQKFERAKKLTIEALSLADSIGDDNGKSYCLINLCLINQSLKKYSTALEYANEAYDVSNKINFKRNMYRANEEMAILYTKLKNYEKAKYYHLKNLNSLDISKDHRNLKSLYNQLSEIFLAQKQFDKASIYQKKYIRLNDSLSNVDFKIKIKLAESINKYEVTVFKNKLLDKDNKLKESELSKSRSINLSITIGTFSLILLIIFLIRAINRQKKQSKHILEQNKIITSQRDEIKSQNEDLNNYKNNLENIIENRTNELKNALEMAKEGNRLKSAFLNNISHEIRTPLNAIIGFAQLIEYQNAKEITKSLGIIIKEGYELLNTVDKIIELAKIESESPKIALKKYTFIELSERISTLIKGITLKNKNKEIDFIINLSKYSGTLMIDIDKLNRILIHLIDNAYKFTEKGKIELNLKEKQNELVFQVKDTGIGIAENDLNSIFDIFHKIDTKAHLTRGTGLGLAIVTQLVKLLKGEIDVESKLGLGTTFSLKISKNN